MRKFLSLLFLPVAIQISAQTDMCFDPNSKAYYRCERNIEVICKDFLMDDLVELEEILLTVHPDPYAYCGKEAFDEAYKKASEFYSEDRTMIEHAQNLNRFIRVVEDSHLQTLVFRLMFESAGYNSGFLPLFIRTIDGKFYVEKDYINGPPVGSEIIAVGKLSMKELHALAKEWSTTEGHASNASDEAATYYYTPSQFFANPTQYAGELETVVFQTDGKLDSTVVQLVSLKELQKIRRKHFKLNNKNIQGFFYLNENSKKNTHPWKGILTIHSFSARPFQNDIKKIRKFFHSARILGVTDIAIDVRDNPGGSSAMVEYLCSFLMPNGLNTPNNIIWKASENSYRIISKFRQKHFPKFTERRFKRDEDLYQYYLLSQTKLGQSDTAFFSIPQRQRREHVYNGNITVFMNGNTVSAACDFAQLLQSHNRASLIGTPCNATTNGTWGNATEVELSQSGISYSIPTIRYNYKNSFSYSRTPIMPDIHLEQTVEDLKSGKDTFLDYFLRN